MSNSREIRRRIKSVASIGQITRAMELVAAAKMRRAQDMAVAGRRYNQTMYVILGKLLPTIDANQNMLLEQPDSHFDQQAPQLLIVFGPDRGLTGGLPSHMIRRVKQHLDQYPQTQLVTMGKRTRDGLIKLGAKVVADFPMVEKPRLNDIVGLSSYVTKQFQTGDYARVSIALPHFYSTLRQEPEITQLLPLTASLLKTKVGSDKDSEEAAEADFLFEPDAVALLNQLLPRFIEMSIYQSLLEAKASEYSAQMIAMKNAGDNAKELEEDLTLTFNQIRQANITAELAEIAAGSGSN